MRQFVFQHAHDAEFLAVLGDLVQRLDYVLHARQLFRSRDGRRIFRPGMKHKIVDPQKCGRFRCLEDFRNGRGPLCGVGRGDVDVRAQMARETSTPPSRVL